MTVDRRQLALGGAVVFVLGWATWTFWPAAPAPPATPPARAARAARAVAGDKPVQPVAPVKLAALTADRDQPGKGARNPFRFQPKVVPPPPRPVVTVPPPTTEPPRPPVPAGPPPLPPIPLKLIGVLERANGVKWAVLTDGKSPSPMYGKDGDIIDGRYAIVKIGTESIEMTYTDGRGRQVIRLTGQ
jgi:hypothetical protein